MRKRDDAAFVRMMLMHHQHGIEMTKLAEGRAS